ncbi:hypothetical protein ACJRO7_034425 [Eucalyptus globulus]|uniref:Retrotransposon gag domain-containing protein n=1 Tax=Eucalyptus globulus TaxID=34317 RepID=A0ABD3J6U3_EUCGL
MPTRVSIQGGRGRAPAQTNASGVAPRPVGAEVAAPGDPKIEGIMRVLEVLGNRMDQQAQNQAAVVEAAAQAATTGAIVVVAEAAPVAAPTTAPVIALAEVPLGNVAAGKPIHKLVERFLKLNLLRFIGEGDPKVTSLWIQDLKKAFVFLMCNEEEKVVVVVYQLQGNANIWWRATKDIVFLEGMVQVWDTFLRAFNDQYFSGTAREQKMEEFQRLHQWSMTVDQYEVKFAELSQYAPRLIEDLEEKAYRFRSGLRFELKQPLLPLDLIDYREVHYRAQMIERGLSEQVASSGLRFSSFREGIRQGKKPMKGGRF